MAIALISTLIPLGVLAIGWLYKMLTDVHNDISGHHGEWKASMDANSREHDELSRRISEINITLGDIRKELGNINERLTKIEARQELTQ